MAEINPPINGTSDDGAPSPIVHQPSSTPCLSFFDCNAQIGRYGLKHPEAFTTAEELLDEMDYCGISDALIYHSMAKEYSPSVGNRMLMQELTDSRLHPCWVVMPHHTEEMPSPDDLLQEMRDKGVRAVRAYPVFHQFRLSDWCASELLEMLESHSIPLLLDFDQINWDEAASLLRDHPRLNLILLRTSYRIDRYLFPLFEKYDNLRIETATYQVNYGIEEICRRFGARRLVFGTGMPITEAGPSIAQITYAEISDEDKALIAGGNLRQILDWH